MSRTLAESTESMIAVMEAFLEGRQIQSRAGDEEWRDNPYPSWQWAEYEFRVKPKEPLEFDLFIDPDGRLLGEYRPSGMIEKLGRITGGRGWKIRVREITND